MLPAVTNPHRDEIAALLRKADCHYGNTVRDEDDELTPAEAAAKRDGVKPSRIVELRRAVHQVADGEHSRTKAQAGHEDGVLRALLHFEAEMTPELRQYVHARLREVQQQFGLPVTTEKLACRTRGAQARRTRTAATPHLEPTPVSDYDELPEPETDGSAAIDEADVYAEYGSAEVALSGPASVEQVHVDEVLPAALKTELFEVKAMAERMASQPEAELGQRFEQYLAARGRQVCCFAITLPDGTVLTTDRCDVDGDVLYEAKSSADRMSVRLALGQVLDYGHHVGRVRADLRLAILLPTVPAPDLVELLQSLAVGCVVEGPLGVFGDLYADADGNSFCP